MISLKRWWKETLCIIFILCVGLIVGYGDYQDRIAYQNCVKQQSLDVTRQDSIECYCSKLVRGGGK